MSTFFDFKILFVNKQTQEILKNSTVIWGYSQTDFCGKKRKPHLEVM